MTLEQYRQVYKILAVSRVSHIYINGSSERVKIHFAHILWNLHQLHILVGIFVQPLCIGHIIFGLYWAAHETGQLQAPTPKTQAKKLKPHQIRPLLVSPP